MTKNFRLKIEDKAIRTWIIIIIALVFLIIMVGGATRLTDSGLSIAHWSPIHGIIPPLTEADWIKEFELYKTIPEYQIQNRGMDISEFEFIFWWEWAHRLLGRIIGLAYLIPFILFAIFKRFHGNEFIVFLSVGLLIGFQGFVGWWMVSSGLSGNRIDVAPYRLASHLGLAFLLLGILVSILNAKKNDRLQLSNIFLWIMVFTYFQIILGAFVAGNRAGFVYNDWPTIGGNLLPDAYFALKPIWHNFIENQQSTQFNHRIWGYFLGISAFAAIFIKNSMSTLQRALPFVLIMAQIIIGIYLLSIFAKFTPPNIVGVLMGVFHQAFAAIVFIFIVRTWKLSQLIR